MNVQPNGHGRIASQRDPRPNIVPGPGNQAGAASFQDTLSQMLDGGGCDASGVNALGSLPTAGTGPGHAQNFNEQGFFQAGAPVGGRNPEQLFKTISEGRPLPPRHDPDAPGHSDGPAGHPTDNQLSIDLPGRISTEPAHGGSIANHATLGVAGRPTAANKAARVSNLSPLANQEVRRDADGEPIDRFTPRPKKERAEHQGRDFSFDLQLGPEGLELSLVLPAMNETERRDLFARLSAMIASHGFKFGSWALNGLQLLRPNKRI